jgi:hypothetical protein
MSSARVARQVGRQAASLDKRTQLRSPSSGHLSEWLLTIYEDTGEVTGTYRNESPSAAPEGHEVEEIDPDERERLNELRTARRRKAQIRRFCVKNKLAVLWTFTYAEAVFDRQRVIEDFAAFTRRFYQRFGRLPWLRVLELHKGGWCDYCRCDHAEGRYHLHAALPAVFIAHSDMEQLWGHGFVHYRRRERRVGEKQVSARDRCRTLARYVSKYVAKECAAGFAQHGYEVAEGFQVRRRHRHFPTLYHVQRWLDHMDFGTLDVALSSNEWEDYHGPPVRVWWFSDA